MKEFKNEYVKLFYIEEQNLCYELWSDTTEKMTVDEWKSTRDNLVTLFRENKPDKLLSDTSQLNFVISPELQEWLAENVTTEIGGFIKKIGIVLSEDLFVKLGVEQLMAEKQTGQILTKYFEKESEAREWLCAKNGVEAK